MKPLILGEAPGRSGAAKYSEPISGEIVRRLAHWSGVVDASVTSPQDCREALSQVFELRNLLPQQPPRVGRGMTFSMYDAREAWEALYPTLDNRVVVLLGSRLRDLIMPIRVSVFGEARSAVWYELKTLDLITTTAQGVRTHYIVRVAAIPHPSGLNRIYNDPAHQEAAGLTLTRAIDMAEMLRIMQRIS